MSLRSVLVLLLPALAVAMYGPSSSVIQLSEAEFKAVLKSDELWLVEFYAPWCGHCKNLVPEWEKAAKALKGVVKVGAVDGTTAEKLMQKYQVQGFPTIKVFGSDKKKPIDYQGERKADAIVSEAMKAANAMVKERMGGKASSSSSGSKSSSSSSSGSKKSSGGSEVVELTEDNFKSLVLDSKDQWLVEFFAPWCGHCKQLAPEWETAAGQLKGSVKLGAVDATVHTNLASQYGVRGYPTIKVFPAGKKSSAVDYNGPRDAAGIVEYSMKLLDESGVPASVDQITDSEMLDDSCGGKKICVMLFVPDILDTGASGRNQYLDTLRSVAKQLRGKPLAFVWSEAGAQPALEQSLEVTFGYPALVLFAKEKQAYALMRTSWSETNIVSFINGVMRGSEKRAKLEGMPDIVKAKKWDGKDGVLQVDEIPLDEIMND